jgi:hypothetical protein
MHTFVSHVASSIGVKAACLHHLTHADYLPGTFPSPWVGGEMGGGGELGLKQYSKLFDSILQSAEVTEFLVMYFLHSSLISPLLNPNSS